MKKPVLFGIILVVIVLALIAYFANKTINQNVGERFAEKVIESQTGAKVDVDSNGEDISIKTEDGQTQYSAGGNVELPDGFPQELVIMEDAKLIMSSSSEAGSSLTYLTDGDQALVFEKYINNISVLGWEKDMEVNMAQGKMLNISKGIESVVITIGDNDTKDTSAKTTVNIIYTMDKDK